MRTDCKFATGTDYSQVPRLRGNGFQCTPYLRVSHWWLQGSWSTAWPTRHNVAQGAHYWKLLRNWAAMQGAWSHVGLQPTCTVWSLLPCTGAIGRSWGLDPQNLPFPVFGAYGCILHPNPRNFQPIAIN